MESAHEPSDIEQPPQSGPGDRELVAAILAGDRKATAEFVACYSDAVYSYVWRRLLPRTDLVEDLVQDILLRAWTGLRQFRAEAKLEQWILGIARHRVQDHYRNRLREPMDQFEAEGAPDEQSSFEPPWDSEMDRQRLQEKTQRVLASLPEAYSVALQWRYWEQWSTRDMSVATGKTEKSLERLLARARDAFRRRWDG